MFKDDDNEDSKLIASSNSITNDSSITEDMENADVVIEPYNTDIRNNGMDESSRKGNNLNKDNPIVERHHKDNDVNKMHVIDQALEEMNMNVDQEPAVEESNGLPYITDNEESTNEKHDTTYDEDVAPGNYELTDGNESDKDSDEEDEPPPMKPRLIDDNSNDDDDDDDDEVEKT